TPDECTAEPMSEEDYAEIMREDMPVPHREYRVVGTPDHDDAVAAAAVLREHEACSINGKTNQKRTLESPYYVHVSNFGTVSDETPQQRQLHRVQHGEMLSSELPEQNPERYIAISEESPSPTEGFPGFLYQPHHAVLLSDGRIAVPATMLLAQVPEVPQLSTRVAILTDAAGTWRVDENLPFCVGEC